MKSVKNNYNFIPRAGQLFSNIRWLEQYGEDGWYKIKKVDNYPPTYCVVFLVYEGVSYRIFYHDMEQWRWKDDTSKK